MAMGFSLSPAVTVREINLTGNVPNLPSAKTGMVLRADQGPALEIVAITKENDLVAKFGKPNATNYQDWMAAWNFLQYASSLYLVRPIDANATTKNAGIGITGTAGATLNEQGNLYNKRVAENTLENFSDVSETLYFFNREVTSEQKLAVAVCSTPQYFKSPIGLEYFAIIASNGVSAVASASVTATGSPTLTNGSQVIFNGNKLATVLNVSQASSASSVITFDRTVADADVNPFFGVAVTASAAITGTSPAQYLAYFSKTGFTLKEGTAVSAGVVSKIENASSTEYAVTFVGNPFITAGNISSNTVSYSGTTAYKNATVGFGVEAGDTEIKLQPGFILEAGVKFTITGIADTLIISSVDKTLNKITLVSPVPSATSLAASGIALTITTPTNVDRLITGINFFDKVYDSGVIQKTRLSLTDPAGAAVNVVAQSLVPFNKVFEYPPNYANGEFALVVLKKNDLGLYANEETFNLSYTKGARDNNGNTIFCEDTIFETSTTVYCKMGSPTNQRVDTAPTALPKITAETSASVYPRKSEYGKQVYDGFGYTQGDIMQAYAMFADPESFDINILTCHQLDLNYASTIAETRKDCVAVVAPYNYAYLTTKSSSDCTQYLLDNFGSQTEYDGKLFTGFGTYSAVYGNMKYQYDKWNNVNRWVSLVGDIAGLYAQTDNTNDPWWAPAGTSRGVIKNAIKLAFNPNKANRDELYVNSINPVMAIAGEGSAIVWGQKTATATPSSFDRVNVRRLLIYLEKTISTACNIGLFEFNDSFTRTRLFNIIDPFLRTVQSRRGLYAYKLVIDESNNDNQVIDANGLVVDIYLQPTKVAEFIRLSAIVVPTGASFSEYVGSF